MRPVCCLVLSGSGETKQWSLQGTSRSLRVYRLECEMFPTGSRIEHLVPPSRWHCLGRLWNLQEV